MGDEVTVKDCTICAMPCEVVSVWTATDRSYVPGSGRITTALEERCTTRCLMGHWYGGPLADVAA